MIDIGHDGTGFSFDCERPRHRVVVHPFRLANRPVTNAEWQAFIDDGGYRSPLLWLADGWATVQAGEWTQPLYWESNESAPATMSLHGVRPRDPSAPVCHVSYFEADAFANWAGKRLATEAEWEYAASGVSREGNFCDSGLLCPVSGGRPVRGPRQMFGDVWEWTRSPFSPYPGFRPATGPAAEYNGKFMVGNIVMRGGSCVTPSGHMRATSRNFFSPATRWQFSGVRLAEDM